MFRISTSFGTSVNRLSNELTNLKSHEIFLKNLKIYNSSTETLILT